MTTTIWAIYFEDGDTLYFHDKEDARTCLWDYYFETYFDQDDEDERIGAENEFNEWSSIDGVGYVYGVEVY